MSVAMTSLHARQDGVTARLKWTVMEMVDRVLGAGAWRPVCVGKGGKSVCGRELKFTEYVEGG